ncbi:MAG: GH116 family glycosyl hydrolase, partial [Phycisphaerae bacterium]
VRGAVGRAMRLAAGEAGEAAFVVAWHFPNHKNGQHYATRFNDAGQVARYVADNLERLTGETQLWHDTYYDSTLPHWLLDRLHMPVSILATNTVQWWKSGRFWAWEGVGCCAGTCTHVWNYEHALARLQPALERSIRTMQDFGEGFDEESGLVGFRSNRAYAADGQCGTVLKAYREHLMSADGAFLKANYAKVRKAMQFMLTQDGDDDGLIANSQHNTFDINFHGPNTFVGSLYLAALRAAEEMAKIAGDDAFAARCRKVFESGGIKTMEQLFDGEYFFQKVDLEKHSKHQYGRGCLADQLFGQNWAHQLGLGYIYPRDAVRKAIMAVYKYNWAPDVGPQNRLHRPERVFARPGEAGLFICTWPKSKHLGPNGVRYRNEVWTGIEYQVAAGLIYEDRVDEGLTIIRAVHDRYDARKLNPWNEVECGDHYARAMSCWGCLLALGGFEYDGPAGRIAMAPRISPDDFRCAFTAAEGWGTLAQRRADGAQVNTISVRWGRLRLTEIAVQLPADLEAAEIELRSGKEPVETAPPARDGERVRLRLSRPIVLQRDQQLVLTARKK